MSATIEDAGAVSTRNGHSCCLICGSMNPRSLNLSFQVKESGGVQTEFLPSPELQGYNGVLHGGVIASLLDAAMTHCLFHNDIKAVTGDLHVRYVYPIPCEVPLHIHANITTAYPPLYCLESEILSDQVVMARAKAKFMRQ